MHGGLLNQILCKVIQEEQPRGALRGFRGEVSPRPSYLDAARPRVGYAEQQDAKILIRGSVNMRMINEVKPGAEQNFGRYAPTQ